MQSYNIDKPLISEQIQKFKYLLVFIINNHAASLNANYAIKLINIDRMSRDLVKLCFIVKQPYCQHRNNYKNISWN